MSLSWYVVYKDKSIHQYDEKNFNIAHIDPDKLDVIAIKHPKAPIPTFILHFDDKRKRPIYVMRNELSSGGRPYQTRCHMIGWQMKVNGVNVQSINYVFETIGRKIMIQDPNNPENKIEVIEEMYWIESAGEFNRSRDSWFKSPSAKQLGIIGSKAQEVK